MAVTMANMTKATMTGEGSDERHDGENGEGRRHGGSRGNVYGCYSWFRALSKLFFREECDRIKKTADYILVNDTLIDNRLSDVHTVCKVRLFQGRRTGN